MMTSKDWHKLAELKDRLPELFDGSLTPTPMVILGNGFLDNSRIRMMPELNWNTGTNSPELYGGSNGHEAQCSLAAFSNFPDGIDPKKAPIALVNYQDRPSTIKYSGAFTYANACKQLLANKGPRFMSYSYFDTTHNGMNTYIEQLRDYDVLCFNPCGAPNWAYSAFMHVNNPITSGPDAAINYHFQAPVTFNKHTLAPTSNHSSIGCWFAVFADAPSFGPPQATAIGAMIHTLEPNISTKDILEIMKKGCFQDSYFEKYVKYGLLNVYKTVQAMLPHSLTAETILKPEITEIDPVGPEVKVITNIGELKTTSAWSQSDGPAALFDQNLTNTSLVTQNHAQFQMVNPIDKVINELYVVCSPFEDYRNDWNPHKIVLTFKDGRTNEVSILTRSPSAENIISVQEFNANDLAKIDIYAPNASRLLFSELDFRFSDGESTPGDSDPIPNATLKSIVEVRGDGSLFIKHSNN